MAFGKEPPLPFSEKSNTEKQLEQGAFNPELDGIIPDVTEFDKNGVPIGGEIHINDPDENGPDFEKRLYEEPPRDGWSEEIE
jgi:hypothetical protein